MKEVKPGDLVLVKREKEERTSCFLIGCNNEVYAAICIDNGEITFSPTKDLLVDYLSSLGNGMKVISKDVVINLINMRLSGEYKYPIVGE